MRLARIKCGEISMLMLAQLRYGQHNIKKTAVIISWKLLDSAGRYEAEKLQSSRQQTHNDDLKEHKVTGYSSKLITTDK